MRSGCTKTGISGITWRDGAASLRTGARTHVALVVDGRNDLLSLSMNGQPDAATALTIRLDELADINNYSAVRK